MAYVSEEKLKKINELISKPASYKFNEKEIKLLKSRYKKNDWKIIYAIYRKHSPKGCYIGFIIDGMPGSVRRSGAENHWEYICTREISSGEYDELIANLGTNNRRFELFLYKGIELLIKEDKDYGVDTPPEFIKVCQERGYSAAYQTKIEFK